MINFDLTFKDIDEFNKHHIKRNASFLQKYLHWIILVFLVVFMIGNLHENNASTSSYLILIPLVLAIIFIQRAFSKFLRRKGLVAYIKKNPRVMGRREMNTNETTLFINIDGKVSEYPYKDFSKLEENKTHFFAYVSEQSAVIIPKRILTEYSEINTIIEKIKKGIK